MLHIIQSNKIDVLFDELLKIYQQPNTKHSVFEPFNVIVPSKVMGEWLKKQVADKAGISTLVTTEFWGRYQLSLMQRVLRTYARLRDDIIEVPEVAMLAKNVMQWQIFGLLMAQRDVIMQDKAHALYPILYPLLTNEDETEQLATPPHLMEDEAVTSQNDDSFAWADNQSLLANNSLSDDAQHRSEEQRLWQLASDMASMLNRYMTYRPDWLISWGENKALPIDKMIADKDRLQNRLQGRTDTAQIVTPDWLVAHYTELERAQRWLWVTLFDTDFRIRQRLNTQFWQAFDDTASGAAERCRRLLPQQLILFTLQQLPPSELLDLQRLGALTEVTLLHFNPSEQFWADIVDKNWLLQQQFDNPETVYLNDYGHTLLSRFGKQSREVFAMLASLSGNEYERVTWDDRFVDNAEPTSLLQNIQQDILMLEEGGTVNKISEMIRLVPRTKPDAINKTKQQLDNIQQGMLNRPDVLPLILSKLNSEYATKRQYEDKRQWQTQLLIDSSLSIHACHSVVRQLEVLRSMVVGWLNYTDQPNNIPKSAWERRALSDILVLLPDVEAQQNTIESIFPKGVGADGYILPAKVTGVVAKDINQLWQAIMGFYRLLNRADARFLRTEVFDWLMLPPLYQSYGLNLEQMSRACELLTQADFVRGFDESHLQQSLHTHDDDYRYSFAYALERLVAGLLMPHADMVSFGQFINRQGDQEYIQPLPNMSLADAGIIAVLCDIFQTLDANRHKGKLSATVSEWLQDIDTLTNEKFGIFKQSQAWRAIFAAQNDLKKHIEANSLQSHPKQNHHNTANTQSNSQAAPDRAINIQTEALPLKLGFVLESIAEQLVSQQVSAEPAGVITFARIGAVRNLPYKLVVMLNLNLSDFPKRETLNRYNLMQASIGVRGDRFQEDDDLGAFLDALLCAQEACWLFYNGKSTVDTHEHLPASPVQELLSFLQTQVKWQSNTDALADGVPNNQSSVANDISLSKENQFLEKVEDYLVTHHPALPFDPSYFQIIRGEQPSNDALSNGDISAKLDNSQDIQQNNSQTSALTGFNETLILAKSRLYPPAKIWHNLYEKLQDSEHHDAANEIVTIWDKPALQQWRHDWLQQKIQLNTDLVDLSAVSGKSEHHTSSNHVQHYHYLNLSKLISGLQRPADTFIQYQNLYFTDIQEQASPFEPLTLSGLSRYQLNALLLSEQLAPVDSTKAVLTDNSKAKSKLNHLIYSGALPAGVNRYQSFFQQKREMQQRLRQFVEKLLAIADGETPDEIAYDLLAFRRFIRSAFDKSLLGDSLLLAEAVAKFITPCCEQRISIDTLLVDEQGQVTPTQQCYTLTAALPEAQAASHWINYLPTSGREKYLVQCWLNHLCWQVYRRTTEQQAQLQDGFSFWQYSDKKTLYLPAITWQRAYQYLQDWLMVWQLAQQTVVVLPPRPTIEYIMTKRHTPEAKLTKLIHYWNTMSYGHEATNEQFPHATWQRLLATKKSSVIVPFIEILGEMLYLPLLASVIDLDNPAAFDITT